MGRSWIVLLTIISSFLLLVNSTDPEVPKQMKRIYRRFKKGKIPTNGVNTVRHIAAHKGSVTSSSVVLFDLAAVNKQETLIKAELYFYKRSSSTLQLQLELSEVSPYYQSREQLERLNLSSRGWQVVDVTPTALKCTNTFTSNNQLGAKFVAVSDDGTSQILDMAEFQRHHDLPFLIIYSNNTQGLDIDQVTGPAGLNEKEYIRQFESLHDPITGKSKSRKRRDINELPLWSPQITVESDRKWNKLPPLYNPIINNEDYFNELTNQIDLENVKEMPTSPPKTPESRQVEATTVPSLVDILETRAPEIKEKIIKTSKKDRNGYKTSLELIPWPKMPKYKPLKTETEEKIPLNFGNVKKTQSQDQTHKNKGCKRESLRLNFDDIGWGSRIIEPKKFDMFYCSGQCLFPYSLGMKPTNHATLQSILSSVRQSLEVPQPCCVPDKLAPVTLMFHDQFGNIVIKVYEDMAVESCSCR